MVVAVLVQQMDFQLLDWKVLEIFVAVVVLVEAVVMVVALVEAVVLVVALVEAVVLVVASFAPQVQKQWLISLVIPMVFSLFHYVQRKFPKGHWTSLRASQHLGWDCRCCHCCSDVLGVAAYSFPPLSLSCSGM
jgi:hypothetical protein